MHPAHIILGIIVALSIAFMLVRPRGIAEIWWVGSGAIALVVFRLIPLRLAGSAIAEGTDVYLFLIGMMLLSELAREHGVFDWLSSVAAHHSRRSASRLFTLIYLIGIAVTALLSNDATAVVLTPAVLAAVRKTRVSPLPYLFACALIANAASFILPISNPANLVVYDRSIPPLAHWLLAFAAPSIVSIVITYWTLRYLFKKELAETTDPESESETTNDSLSPSGKLVLLSIALTAVILITASSLGKDLGLPTCLCAVAFTAFLSLRTRTSPTRLLREISWSTIALVAALFILVRAVETIGALHMSQAALLWAVHQNEWIGALVASFAVGIANNIVNNLPLGLIAGSAVRSTHTSGLLALSVLIGIDLGPNLSVTGSLATILWLIALRREQQHVTFWSFLRIGVIAMPLALFGAIGTALLTHMLLGG
ncbi:arsenic transporter [Acidicapsa dinghuensis]|uniref:Arsenic transporter n=1 Tax=Acidicapsa dinghuensis TaxID=2218256 RepID=A0ABW1EIQ8_9BACT|nr:arsenic transporter [Acidicapsa dinghuensis]